MMMAKVVRILVFIFRTFKYLNDNDSYLFYLNKGKNSP